MENARADWKRQGDEYVAHIRRLEKELQDQKKHLYDKEQAWDDERRKLKAEIEALVCKVHQLEDKLVILNEIKSQRDELMENLKKYQAARDQLHEEIQRLKAEYERLRLSDKAHFDTMMGERKTLEGQLDSHEARLTDLSITIKRLETQKNELEGLIDSLNDKCEQLKDVKTQLIGAQNVNKELVDEKDKLRSELNTAGDFMLDLEQKVHKANNTSLELLN